MYGNSEKTVRQAFFESFLKEFLVAFLTVIYTTNTSVLYVTNSGEGEGLIFYGSTIIPFKDKFDKSLRLYALMTTKPSEMEKNREKLPVGEQKGEV